MQNFPGADFFIHCLPEEVLFGVKKVQLAEGSGVFSNMFLCCEQGKGTMNTPTRTLEIYESANMLSLLLHLLHEPPSPYSKDEISSESRDFGKYAIVAPTSAIPLPLLPALFQVADKYALALPTIHALQTHLAAYVSTAPLVVYGLATQLSLPFIADAASAFLITPPLHTYSLEQISAIPTAEAYHTLLLLLHHRTCRIKELLLHEDLFPHGYGVCLSHRDSAKLLWEEKRRALLPHVDADTDVAAEMSIELGKLTKCPTCHKAWLAATDMLAYKCQKIARRISKLPNDN
ncbi:hypothetical protein DFH11DRAFT_71694 [Phellopilus nigrolimitatus]|nr:hypothetical protein DFH11DRAFT_71694 [Phellopilus nigrolimitatus]